MSHSLYSTGWKVILMCILHVIQTCWRAAPYERGLTALTERPICKSFDKCDKNKLNLSTLSKQQKITKKAPMR